MDKLPIYEMIIEENPTSDIGVSFVALVNKPAIEKNFIAFNKDEAKHLDFKTDTERKIISGPAMVANSLIYRKDENGEYNVFFSKKTVEDIALKFFKMDYQKNLNLFHDPNLSLNGVTIFESFVTDAERGIQPMKGFEDLPDGTWFISVKVENDEVWKKVKAGEVKGFSVEGIFSYVKQQRTIEEQIVDILNRTLNGDSHLEKRDIMSSVKDMVATFKAKFFNQPAPAAAAPAANPDPAAAVMKTDYTLKDGTMCSIDKMEPGGVMMIGEAPAAAGEYELTDGTKLMIGEGGVISAVTPAPAAAEQQSAAPTQTPEQILAAIKDVVLKFENQTTDVEQKLATAKTEFETFTSGVDQKIKDAVKPFETQISEAKATIEKQDGIIKGLFELVEKMADLPTVEDPTENKTSFSSDKANKKEAKLKLITESLANLKKSKTA